MTDGATMMGARIGLLWPELILLAAAVVVAILGLSRSRTLRGSCGAVSIGALLIAGLAALTTGSTTTATELGVSYPAFAPWFKALVAVVGAGLVAVQGGFVDRPLEQAIDRNAESFNPLRAVRGEFAALTLFSVCGVMLLATATDLIWLFLALELVSLPTYVMVAIGRGDRAGLEAAVKYFFLGALATGVMLMGFALMYGAAGSLDLTLIRNAFGAQSMTTGLPLLAVAGLTMTLVGLCFKITAVPMHFYAPDVYEGAPLPVTAFLAFMPKAAGFVAMVLVLRTAGLGTPEGLPAPIHAILWMMAIITMCLGNIGALLQPSIKRTLAYSSIAHSGYMLVALVTGTADAVEALFFYLLAYAVTTVATFGGLSVIQRGGQDADRFEDLAGMRRAHPWATATIVMGALSFTGIPPLLGFVGKVWILTAAFEGGQVALAGFLVVNSLVSARYYLRFLSTPVVAEAESGAAPTTTNASLAPAMASVVFGAALLIVPFAAKPFVHWVEEALSTSQEPAVTAHADDSNRSTGS